jgi:thiol-disulfide isomerase/thioredoxin
MFVQVLTQLLIICLLAQRLLSNELQEVSSAKSASVSSGVVEVDGKNSLDFFSGQKLLIEFYAPWCGHCNRFSSTYDEIAAELEEGKHGFKVGKVDVTTNAAILGRFSVASIPTIFLYRDGQTWQYSGGALTKDNVVDWALNPQQAPMSFFESPFGPIGRTKGIMYHIGTRVGDLSLEMADYFGISHMFGIVIVSVLGGMIVLIITLAGVFMSIPAHEKTE